MITATFGCVKTAAKVNKPSYEIHFTENNRLVSGTPAITGRAVVFVVAGRRYKGDFGQSGSKIYTHSELEPLDPNEPDPVFNSHTFGTILHGVFKLTSGEKVELLVSEIPETAGATLSVEVIHPHLTVLHPALASVTAIAESVLSSAGAGFGDAETNAMVEKAAIDFVTAEYASKNWDVRNRDHERNLGYDLECTRSGETRHVEVKGVNGTREEFIITRNELEKSETDPHFILAIVTAARSSDPTLHEYTGSEAQSRFGFLPIAYSAKPKSRVE